MNDVDDSFDAVMASVVEDTYLEALDPETREVVIDHLNARIDGRVLSHDLLGLVLVMLDIRPACIVGSQQRAITRERALDVAAHPEEATRWDPVGQFLDQYDIPFEVIPKVDESRIEGVTLVHLNYHVSLDEDRVRAFAAENTESPTGDGLSRADEERLGEFLGYPDAAIEAYCLREHMVQGHLIETVDDTELEEALGSLTVLYDALDLDYRTFTRYLLPYVVPATVPECLDRIVGDTALAVGGGLAVADRYECTVFDQVVADYRDRFAPEAE